MLLPTHIHLRTLATSPRLGRDALKCVASELLGAAAADRVSDVLVDMLEKRDSYSLHDSDGRVRAMWEALCEPEQPETKLWWDMYVGSTLDIWKVMEHLKSMRVSETNCDRACSHIGRSVHVGSNLSPAKVTKLTQLFHGYRALKYCIKQTRPVCVHTLVQAADAFGGDMTRDEAQHDDEEARLQLADDQLMDILGETPEGCPPQQPSCYDLLAASKVAELQASVDPLDFIPLRGHETAWAVGFAILRSYVVSVAHVLLQVHICDMDAVPVSCWWGIT